VAVLAEVDEPQSLQHCGAAGLWDFVVEHLPRQSQGRAVGAPQRPLLFGVPLLPASRPCSGVGREMQSEKGRQYHQKRSSMVPVAADRHPGIARGIVVAVPQEADRWAGGQAGKHVCGRPMPVRQPGRVGSYAAIIAPARFLTTAGMLPAEALQRRL